MEVQLKSNFHKPIYHKAFPIANKDREFLKSQLDQLEDLQVVLERILISEWAFPAFMVPKKDGTAFFVSDFFQLNEVIKDFQNDLPRIQEVSHRRSGFDWASSLHLTSQFYHFELGKTASKLCVINTPYGLYCYLCLPMGLKISPGYAQAVLSHLFSDLPFVEVFLDDIAIFTKGSFKQHLDHICIVLCILNKHDFLH